MALLSSPASTTSSASRTLPCLLIILVLPHIVSSSSSSSSSSSPPSSPLRPHEDSVYTRTIRLCLKDLAHLEQASGHSTHYTIPRHSSGDMDTRRRYCQSLFKGFVRKMEQVLLSQSHHATDLRGDGVETDQDDHSLIDHHVTRTGPEEGRQGRMSDDVFELVNRYLQDKGVVDLNLLQSGRTSGVDRKSLKQTAKLKHQLPLDPHKLLSLLDVITGYKSYGPYRERIRTGSDVIIPMDDVRDERELGLLETSFENERRGLGDEDENDDDDVDDEEEEKDGEEEDGEEEEGTDPLDDNHDSGEGRPTGVLTSQPGKRGWNQWYSIITRAMSKRRRHELSINNALVSLTDMLLEEGRQRLMQNRQNIRYHMYRQG